MDSTYEDIMTVPQPKGMKKSLFRHQLASIYNMERLESEKVIMKEDSYKETVIGILADQSGYGKTLSMIGLLARNRMDWDMNTPHVFEKIVTKAGGRIKNHYVQKYDKMPSTVILVSPSILKQWEKELNDTELKYISMYTQKHIENYKPEIHQVILIIPSLYNDFIRSHPNVAWKRFIFDEPGHIKVPAMKPINAGFYWFITATPRLMVTNHQSCRTSFMRDIVGDNYWWNDDIFDDIVVKNPEEFIRMSFDMPPTVHIHHQCYQPVVNVVNGFVSSFIHRMLEAGNIEGAITALGGNNTNNVVELVKRKKMEELEEIESKVRIYTIRGDETRIKEWTDRRVRLMNQLNELEERFKVMLEGDCVICANKLVSPILEPQCHNLFCGECLLKWLEKHPNCPMCRAKVDPVSLIYIKTGAEEIKEEPKHVAKKILTKSETVVKLISDNKDGRFLIFSDYDDSFSTICRILDENRIKYVEIKGATKTREHNLEKFKKGDINVIFLNSKHNGSGLNLQETTDIILYHEMTDVVLNQVLGRANRIGRLTPLNVHYLDIV